MEVVELPLNKIVPSVFQPRETFPKDELQELADSMK
ncbi:MAG: chromosome partitioning protein ParB, partial [Candidatus Heimdallarchaeota archaeon]|nr:chromosome partitioning protein ParB [Candidatus Heimdallarchaeota archaeon]